MAISCGENKKENENNGIIVKKSARTRVKGRIIEKVRVVQIPLTAGENNLRGVVHTVAYTTYGYDTKAERALRDSGLNVYDEQGRLTRQDAWDKKGNKKWECVYEYDKTGKLTRWMLNMIAKGVQDTTTFAYDTKGNKIKAETRANDPAISGRKEYTYDEQGNETSVTEYASGNKIRSLSRSNYNNMGDQVVLADLFPDRTPYMTRTATYDLYGSIVSLQLYVGDSMTSKSVMTNDGRGKHVEIKMYDGKGRFSGRAAYAYDTSGNMVEHTNYDASDAPADTRTVLEHEYDSAGNVTRTVTYTEKKGKRSPQNSVVYRYTYYRK
ncbi:hypothetical protein GCM10023093_03310 [Nemorincola caseinilytica]|uniref:RHS repeat protein n=2 Tax=Nemorincola caseinilytica TaxID=2054315 RepID=A0ABP8N636_9BACT